MASAPASYSARTRSRTCLPSNASSASRVRITVSGLSQNRVMAFQVLKRAPRRVVLWIMVTLPAQPLNSASA